MVAQLSIALSSHALQARANLSQLLSQNGPPVWYCPIVFRLSTECSTIELQEGKKNPLGLSVIVIRGSAGMLKFGANGWNCATNSIGLMRTDDQSLIRWQKWCPVKVTLPRLADVSRPF